jgi:hypothetical protein
MNITVLCRHGLTAIVLLAGDLIAFGQASFRAPDNRLPSPYRPFVMEGGPVGYGGSGQVTVFDLKVQALNPADVEFPITLLDSQSLDSSFPISYELLWGIGLAPPTLSMGQGAMHVIGATPLGFSPFIAEVVQLDLAAIAPIPEISFREAPPIGDPILDVLRESRGLITTEPAPGGMHRISAFFDVVTEISLNGGSTWLLADDAIRLAQVPEPSSALLAVIASLAACGAISRRRT